MSSPYTLNITPEEAKEMPMVDLAFLILKEANTPFYYRDLMNEIARIKGISGDEMMEVIAQVYTEINIDGRFACVGNNLWGLKRWYPVEKSDEAVNTQRPRVINDDDDEDLDDEEDLFEDDLDDDDDEDLDEDDDDGDEDEDDDDDLDDDLDDDYDEELDEDDDDGFDDDYDRDEADDY